MMGGDRALVEFRFASRLADGLPEAVLIRLEREAMQFNRLHGLTGEMRLVGRTLRQVVEGSWPVVMPLAARILTDQRHTAISISAFRPIRARRFQDWTAVGFSRGQALPGRSWEANLRLLSVGTCPDLAARAVSSSAT
jgi:hypothetical protein